LVEDEREHLCNLSQTFWKFGSAITCSSAGILTESAKRDMVTRHYVGFDFCWDRHIRRIGRSIFSAELHCPRSPEAEIIGESPGTRRPTWSQCTIAALPKKGAVEL